MRSPTRSKTSWGTMNEAVIVAAVRTPVGKAPSGVLRGTRPDELAATVIGEALRRAPGIDAAEVDDVILGCAMPEAEQGLNVARIASLRAGVPVSASAVTINRFCSSGLQAIAFASERIICGSADVIVAGGTESMSLVPMGGHTVAPNPALVDSYPDVYLSTGLVAENHARESGISREAQDAFALRSHQRAVAAIEAGRRRNWNGAPFIEAGRAPQAPDPGSAALLPPVLPELAVAAQLPARRAVREGRGIDVDVEIVGLDRDRANLGIEFLEPAGSADERSGCAQSCHEVCYPTVGLPPNLRRGRGVMRLPIRFVVVLVRVEIFVGMLGR